MGQVKSKLKEALKPELVETKEQKLVRLAGKRVEKACKAIVLIGNLAAYKPTSDDVDNIMNALGGTCAAVDARLRGGVKQAVTFNLRTVPPSHG